MLNSNNWLNLDILDPKDAMRRKSRSNYDSDKS